MPKRSPSAAQRPGGSLRRKKMMEPYLFLLPVLVILLLLFGWPLINTLVMSFQKYKIGAAETPFNGFGNYETLFTNNDFGLILRNTLVYVFASVAGQFLLGFVLALALWKPFKGRGIYQSIVFLPWAFSSFVVGLMFRWSFNGEYGVVNDLLLKLGIITENIAWLGAPGYSLAVIIFAMIWMGIPFFAIMILAALQSIPADVFEAADIDGCGTVRKFFRITIPFIKPTLIMTLLLRTIWIFNSIDLVVVITNGGPANHSMTLSAFMYARAFAGYDFGLASAIGVVIMLALTVYTLVFLKATHYNEAGDL